jgi:transcriptional regulator with XRE-family HTH domain
MSGNRGNHEDLKMLVSKLTDKEKECIGTKIREGLEAKGLTQDYLAALLGVDPRTIRNMLSGKSLTVPRLNQIGSDLEINFDTLETSEKKLEVDCGGYPKHSIEKYLGNYVAIRHSLDASPNLHCSFYTFDWHEEKQAIRFSEENKFIGSNDRPRNYSQGGLVHISPDIGLLHLMTSWRGAVRLITLSKLRLDSQMMYGALLTQSDQRFGFMPAMTPIAFRKIEDAQHDHVPEVSGPIKYQTEMHSYWKKYLDTAEQDYVSVQSKANYPAPDSPIVKLDARRV